MINSAGIADRKPSAKPPYDLGQRTKQYALRIIRLYEALPERGAGHTLGLQILRSGTSVGAHVAESAFAKSRADYTCKLDGAMQELQETRYWLAILSESGMVKPSRMKALEGESAELMAICVSIVKKTRHTK